MFKILKKARELVKEETKLKHDMRRVQRISLDYEALQNIVNSVATKDVEIDIDTEDGMHIKVIPKFNSGVPYESFADKYKKQHNTI